MRSRSVRTPQITMFSVSLALMPAVALAQYDYESALGSGILGIDLPDDQFAGLHTVGDFNHDGVRDLLLHNLFDRAAWVLIGDAQGNFTRFGPYETDINNSIVAGQFDDDPDPEIAFRQSTFGYAIVFAPETEPVDELNVSVDYTIFGNGSDAFAPVIKAADFDGDGKDELCFNTSDDVVYIRWSATETLSSIALSGLGEQNAIYDPADYDGDGDLDLLLFAQESEHFWIIEGTGAGSMGIAREIQRAYPSIANDDRPAFGQLDSNPAMDMIVANISEQSMSNEYNFVLNSASSEEIDTDEVALPLLITDDLDGEGNPDLVVMRLGLFPVGIAPEFEPGVMYNPTGAAPYVADLTAGQPRAYFVYDQSTFDESPMALVSSFDADDDGDDDLIWHGYSGSSGGSLWVIENRSGVPGVPRIGMESFEVIDGILNTLPIDLDSDGFDEFIISNSGNMRILDLQEGSLDRITASNDAFMVVKADLDGDGTPEIINSDNGVNRLRVWSVMPDGSVGNRQVFPTDERGPYLGLEVADFNNDGLDDIAAMENNGSVDIYLGGVGPDLTLWAEVDALSPLGLKPGVLDYNGDGLPDLAIGSGEYSGIALFANNGDGTFSEGPALPSSQPSATPYWITTGDLDLDGNTDIAFSDRSSQLVTVMYLQSGGTLDESIDIYRNDVVELFIEDLDSDGLPDLALGASGLGSGIQSPGVFLQDGPRAFGRFIPLPGTNSQSIAISDVNLDGAADLVSVSEGDRQFRTYLATPNLCPADLNGDGELNFFDVSYFLVDQTDYNSDGVFNFFDVAAFLADYLDGCP